MSSLPSPPPILYDFDPTALNRQSPASDLPPMFGVVTHPTSHPLLTLYHVRSDSQAILDNPEWPVFPSESAALSFIRRIPGPTSHPAITRLLPLTDLDYRCRWFLEQLPPEFRRYDSDNRLAFLLLETPLLFVDRLTTENVKTLPLTDSLIYTCIGDRYGRRSNPDLARFGLSRRPGQAPAYPTYNCFTVGQRRPPKSKQQPVRTNPVVLQRTASGQLTGLTLSASDVRRRAWFSSHACFSRPFLDQAFKSFHHLSRYVVPRNPDYNKERISIRCLTRTYQNAERAPTFSRDASPSWSDTLDHTISVLEVLNSLIKELLSTVDNDHKSSHIDHRRRLSLSPTRLLSFTHFLSLFHPHLEAFRTYSSLPPCSRLTETRRNEIATFLRSFHDNLWRLARWYSCDLSHPSHRLSYRADGRTIFPQIAPSSFFQGPTYVE